MDDFTIIGGTQVKAGDYVEFKREEPQPITAGYPLKSTVVTHTYEGTVVEVRESEVCLHVSDHLQWIAIFGAVMIKHTPYRKVGYWEIQNWAGLNVVCFWGGKNWKASPGGHPQYLDESRFSKEFYIGPSGLD